MEKIDETIMKILEMINKQDIYNQRQLSKISNLSLGKTNAILQNLLDNNIVNAQKEENKNKYYLTKEGFNILENHLKKTKEKKINIHNDIKEKRNINTAVILAAGKKKDFQKPVSFLELDDNIIIERIIEILMMNDIENIVIITGYKKEYFNCLLKKYKGIKLVENPKYKWTGTMSSLALAKDYVKEDFILIESDLVFEERAISKVLKNENKDCILITNESGSGDEAFVEIRNGFIYKMSKDMHQFNKIDGEMIGISKISLEVFNKMLQEFKENRNPYLNYEYMLLDLGMNYNIGYVKINDLVWAEVDTNLQYERLMKNIYPMLKRKEAEVRINIVKETLSYALNVDIKDIKSIFTIGGMTNKNFKVKVKEQDYVLRIPGPGTSNMINRYNEKENAVLASKLKIDSPIIYFNEKSGVKVSKFIENTETLNPKTAKKQENMKLTSQVLRKLHNSKLSFNNKFDVFESIELYENLLKNKYNEIFEGYKETRRKVFQLKEVLNNMNIKMCTCHNDTVPENFIKSGEDKVYLIDWEYSGMNDPMWDLAAHFLECSFMEKEEELFLKYYFETNYSEEDYTHKNNFIKENNNNEEDIEEYKKRIFIHKILQDFLWSIWTKIKEETGEDLGTYGEDRFSRAKKNIKILEEQYGEL